MQQLVLASSSKYRAELLARLRIAFTQDSPDIDESANAGESATELVARLALAKARALAPKYPDALLIGADQVGELNGGIVGKPRDHAHAISQLQAASGRAVMLHSGLTLLDARRGSFQRAVIPYEVQMRELSRQMIEDYLRAESPYDCCGSLKAEGLGIVLLERLRGDDPSAILGLPLIKLAQMLRRAGVDI